MLGKASDVLQEFAKMTASKGEEADDEHVSTTSMHISRAVEAAMISVSILLPKHPELLKRFFVACSMCPTQQRSGWGRLFPVTSTRK